MSNIEMKITVKLSQQQIQEIIQNELNKNFPDYKPVEFIWKTIHSGFRDDDQYTCEVTLK